MIERLRLPGTYRSVSPEETWESARVLFDAAGITRVSDVTHLDHIGIPVAIACRPTSATLAVAQGKGATLSLARVSAAMESLELWHAERSIDAAHTGCARDLKLPYSIHRLAGRRIADGYIDQLVLDWTPGIGMLSGASILVPVDAVRLNFSERSPWHLRAFASSSNGIASGNSRSEAALHGLYELIERHLAGGLTAGRKDARRLVDITSIDDASLLSLVARLDQAHVTLELAEIPNTFGVSCFVAHIWSEEYPIVCGGSGCHSDTSIAASRAITEAVQSRLTQISGTRDDIASRTDRLVTFTNPLLPGTMKWSEVVTDLPTRRLDEEVEWAAEKIVQSTSAEPIIVEFDNSMSDLAFLRVLAPGLTIGDLRTVPV
ncbi:YcaO-like family protein [Nocardioides carbamazepini]|uniref:YcaO-like family protein n=1 Tax=Nocardioides carbamazepini TaxID=2854259 RepID=UPI002149AA73|nr:YcaO-like family protein [Nocardioides carbamazepini]MCR1785886.1 YcaO-like family protein [Nocardioides carbamazepini]